MVEISSLQKFLSLQFADILETAQKLSSNKSLVPVEWLWVAILSLLLLSRGVFIILWVLFVLAFICGFMLPKASRTGLGHKYS